MNRQKTISTDKPAHLPRGREAKQCRCGRWFSLPSCHAKRHHSCSDECKKAELAQREKKRMRVCIACGTEFVASHYQVKSGIGRFCSISCSTKAYANSEAFKLARVKGVATFRASVLAGRVKIPKGSAHPQWTGGRTAASRRRTGNGKSLAAMRDYRKKNPEKVREWAQKRKSGKIGRLPRGTISRIYSLQRGKCANCKTRLSSYHVDHIRPIARGGLHEPHNLQLLCAHCNLTKSARDPIVFAQMHGRLL